MSDDSSDDIIEAVTKRTLDLTAALNKATAGYENSIKLTALVCVTAANIRAHYPPDLHEGVTKRAAQMLARMVSNPMGDELNVTLEVERIKVKAREMLPAIEHCPDAVLTELATEVVKRSTSPADADEILAGQIDVIREYLSPEADAKRAAQRNARANGEDGDPEP